MRAKLARSASGFGNSGGGVIVWGVSTEKHSASGLDVLSQIEPIGNVKRLARQIDRALPGLTVPRLALESSRILHGVRGDTKGLIVTYIPPTPGDPVQSTVDRSFYFRSGDEFNEMPYEMLKRMFAGASGPLLHPSFDERIVKIGENGVWDVPIVINNESSATAREWSISVSILTPEACESVTASGRLQDASDVNPGETIFIASGNEPTFRGLGHTIGSLRVRMKSKKRPRRILGLRIQMFTDRMRATEWEYKIQLASNGFSIRGVKERFIY